MKLANIGFCSRPYVAVGVLMTARRWLALALTYLPADKQGLTIAQFIEHLEAATQQPDHYIGVVNDLDEYLIHHD